MIIVSLYMFVDAVLLFDVLFTYAAIVYLFISLQLFPCAIIVMLFHDFDVMCLFCTLVTLYVL